MSTEKTGPFGGLSASEAGRLSWEKRRERQAAEVAELSGPVVTEADTDAIIRALRDKAKAGDLGAARELREWVEIRKEDEGRSSDKRLLELLSPELRDAIAEELYGDELPASWPHQALTTTK
jgi:hypothetical protein